MRRRFPFRYLEPTLFSGLLDDPVLYLRVRPSGRALMFDCGQIHHLAKRVLKSVDALFVSHAHMDHFMGFDTFIRNNHISSRTIDLYGPPGIAGKAARKLAAYDWNLSEPSWCSLRVHEVFPDRTATFLFPGAEGFPCRPIDEAPRTDRTIYRSDFLEVAAESCDHRIPSLVFRVTECPSFRVDEAKIGEAGLIRGDWLRDLKRMFYRGMNERKPLTVLRRQGEKIVEEVVDDHRKLYEAIRLEEEPASVGYVTDIGFSEENLEKVLTLMKGVTLLVCECSFLAADREKARISRHLCTADLNIILERLRPAFVIPMHLSKCYSGRSRAIYDELEPAAGVTLLHLRDHVAPRPLLAFEVPYPC
jgi:ribonuclease Z